MKRLWSPWRSLYIQSFNTPGRKAGGKSLFVRAATAKNDDRHLIVWRGKHCFVIMNRFPYNSGHLMVVPYRATSRVEDLTGEEMHEIMETSQRAFRALRKLMNPDGFNFGANIGRAAGAGIDNHIHFHIVPRWNGDTNFMPLLADVKVVSEDTVKTMKKLRKFF